MSDGQPPWPTVERVPSNDDNWSVMADAGDDSQEAWPGSDTPEFPDSHDYWGYEHTDPAVQPVYEQDSGHQLPVQQPGYRAEQFDLPADNLQLQAVTGVQTGPRWQSTTVADRRPGQQMQFPEYARYPSHQELTGQPPMLPVDSRELIDVPRYSETFPPFGPDHSDMGSCDTPSSCCDPHQGGAENDQCRAHKSRPKHRRH